ncbi:MAG TPA: hypothetical protein VEC01_08500 [Noviherbaspirillum sp.]|uniref:hypothetical protein n=1 Tax=Noviherbaspirillum sp. TaxID=1926288 RepID=UPI002D57E950|nr:hypothetical protein [Noviherbaspirillum sp.]HYD95352.1 hypothetical protein [Noviherbaspirillum sp.]
MDERKRSAGSNQAGMTPGNSRTRKSASWIGRSCVGLSLFSWFLGLGMPGAGWLLAATVLTIAALRRRMVGTKYLIASFLFTTVHLLTIGPLGNRAGTGSRIDAATAFFLAVFVLTPMLAALLAIFMAAYRK